ncbi:glycosyltransferase family A protein [Algoriphagus limi]|uniref:Glycosyltransferase family 2 protein n=1 Tax=Algoriphagus limi TaxID=2975273 RepID=A0ABT2G6K9_9BACT|nr:glycosyltransferase family A protein [Algoriphagus limi]MCS5490116.1 glycosyltransferase family 2 protein [Algoriphagus limi]
MEKQKKVTVICIAFNHEDWIVEALESVAMQDYYAKELVIIDNGSLDNTPQLIRDWVNSFTGLFSVKTIFYDDPKPYCSVFNSAFFESDGDYVVDLAGDDVLYPDHLSLSIKQLSKDPKAAFCFSDAYLLTSSGAIHTFYKRNTFSELVEEVEVGNLYETLLRRTAICAATMVFNAKILKKEGGYDENLFYEDFDIQIRLTRKYSVVFSDHVGVLKRLHPRSMSAQQYQRYISRMLPSTVKVCEKALELNQSEGENKALQERVLFELKHATWSANFLAAENLIHLAEKLHTKNLKLTLYKWWLKTRLDISWLYVHLTG